jgi:3'-phosphoadenosine 5'-phosphosulfate sulfotransferase (PAPS reductase)/FAD synthetase
MARYANLKDYEKCGFASRGAMQRALSLCSLSTKGEREAFKAKVLRGDRAQLAERLESFNSGAEFKRSPFLIEGPAAVGVSGGRTSGYMLWRILEAHGGQLPDDVVCIFQNTGKERDETLDFLHEIETRWNVPIIWLEYVAPEVKGGAPRTSRYRRVTYETAYRNSWPDQFDGDQAKVELLPGEEVRRRPFNAMFDCYTHYRAAKGEPPVVPNIRQRFCTGQMKMKTQSRYLIDEGWDDWTGVAGIRHDEPRRIANARLSLLSEKVEPIFPLNDAKVDEDEVMAFWASQDFDLELEQGEGNCDICFLKSVPKQLAIMRRYPHLASWWIDREKEVGDVFRRDLSRKPDAEGRIGFAKMLARAQNLSDRDLKQMVNSGMYADTIPCSCTD